MFSQYLDTDMLLNAIGALENDFIIIEWPGSGGIRVDSKLGSCEIFRFESFWKREAPR